MGPVLLFAGALLVLLGAASSVRTNVAATRPMRRYSQVYGVLMLLVGLALVGAGVVMLAG
jgi:hypothetical protein